MPDLSVQSIPGDGGKVIGGLLPTQLAVPEKSTLSPPQVHPYQVQFLGPPKPKCFVTTYIYACNHAGCSQKYNRIDHHSTCSLFQPDGQSKTRCANTVDEDSPMYRIYLDEVCDECTQLSETKDQKREKLLEPVKPDEIPGQDPANGRCYGTAYYYSCNHMQRSLFRVHTHTASCPVFKTGSQNITNCHNVGSYVKSINLDEKCERCADEDSSDEESRGNKIGERRGRAPLNARCCTATYVYSCSHEKDPSYHCIIHGSGCMIFKTGTKNESRCPNIFRGSRKTIHLDAVCDKCSLMNLQKGEALAAAEPVVQVVSNAKCHYTNQVYTCHHSFPHPDFPRIQHVSNCPGVSIGKIRCTNMALKAKEYKFDYECPIWKVKAVKFAENILVEEDADLKKVKKEQRHREMAEELDKLKAQRRPHQVTMAEFMRKSKAKKLTQKASEAKQKGNESATSRKLVQPQPVDDNTSRQYIWMEEADRDGEVEQLDPKEKDRSKNKDQPALDQLDESDDEWEVVDDKDGLAGLEPKILEKNGK